MNLIKKLEKYYKILRIKILVFREKQIAKELIDQKIMSKKDEKLFLYCYSLVKCGWKKHNQIAKELNLKSNWFENLKKNNYFNEDGTINIKLNNDIEFALMMLTAEGLIKESLWKL